ncbi:expressed protein [Phakopsora pachyrhizi]|uniref:Expressed protein n=1 Tax=Phakopsora pachyrhizi TaxID=170000 RepID=A0AAV0AHI5_PHAPC|nr:expressed protein [Phakopsora pachyrhizi]
MADIDSSIIFIFHKYLFWIISGFQILFIGALIIAFFQCKNHRHPLILTFLIVSWLASWIALLPFLAGVWDEARDLSLYRSNVNAGSVQFTACQANAMLIVYLWTVISGLVSFFSAEVFRVMLKCSKIAFLKKYERSSNGDDQKSSDMNFSDCRNPEHCFKIQSSRASSRLHSFPSELINQIRKRTQRRTLVVWECFLVMAPFITSLPALIINARRFTKYDWGAVHVPQAQMCNFGYILCSYGIWFRVVY